MTILTFFAIFAIAIMAATPVLADSMDCGTGVVIQGDLEGDVLEKGGEPTYTQGNRWIYDDGSSDEG